MTRSERLLAALSGALAGFLLALAVLWAERRALAPFPAH